MAANLAISALATSSLDLNSLLQYGILGLVLAAILLGRLVPDWALKRQQESNDQLLKLKDDYNADLKAERDKAVEGYRELQQTILTQIMPTLSRSNELAAQTVQLIGR